VERTAKRREKDMPGIKADFVQPLEPRHICGYCKLVVTLPMQTDCGHIFCNDCLKQAMSSGETIQCPIDGEKISQVEAQFVSSLDMSYYYTSSYMCLGGGREAGGSSCCLLSSPFTQDKQLKSRCMQFFISNLRRYLVFVDTLCRNV